MSADNGIYILITPTEDGKGKEYRVTHAQAIDNITYEHPDGNPEEVVAYFGTCLPFYDEKNATEFAFDLYDEWGYTEYGIVDIELPKPFSQYEREAGENG